MQGIKLRCAALISSLPGFSPRARLQGNPSFFVLDESADEHLQRRRGREKMVPPKDMPEGPVGSGGPECRASVRLDPSVQRTFDSDHELEANCYICAHLCVQPYGAQAEERRRGQRDAHPGAT